MTDHDDLGARMRDATRGGLPAVSPPELARRRAGRRAVQTRGAAAALSVVAAVGAAVLLTDGSGGRQTLLPATPLASTSPVASVSPVASPPTVSAAPTDAPASSSEPSVVPSVEPSAASPTEPTTPPAPPVVPSPTEAPPAQLVLGGDDLGVTRVGAPYADAVRAVTAVLGPPLADPSPTTGCVGAQDLEVEWAGFRLAVSDGAVSGWSSRDPALETPSGIGIGTTVETMQRVYGERLRLHGPNPDDGPGFVVDGVELGGNLTGTTSADRVTRFYNRACSPP